MSEGASVKRIVRASHDKQNPYFMMLRSTAQNKNLSYEARGLIAYLLSKPDDWEIMIEDLCQECGRGRVYRIIKDLLDDNYLERIYHRDERGKIVYVEYVVHEQPFLENPQMANPKVDNPKVGNRTLHNTDGKQKKEKEQKKDNGATPPTINTLMKNAIASAFGYDAAKLTKSEWTLIGKTASELLEVGATPDDMKPLHKYCASKFKDFGAAALSKHWNAYKASRPTNGNGNGKGYTATQKIAIEEAAKSHGLSVEEYLTNMREWQK